MDNLNGKIVTVFGGTGFIGKYIVGRLAKAGYTVKVVGRRAEQGKDIKTSGFVGQVVPIGADLTKQADLEELIKGSYAVVNCVGILYESGKQRFDLLHAQIPEKMAQIAKKLDVKRFIHISAIVNEESNSKYARSKINGEKAVVAAFPGATILKPSVVFGAEDNFFNFFAKMSNFSPCLPIPASKTKFQPVYVGDIADAVLKCVKTKSAGRFELGGPEKYSFREILELILKYTGRKRVLFDQPRFMSQITAIITPSSILTLDQVELLKHDNIVGKNALTFKSLDIEPTDIDSIVPNYLGRMKNAA